MFHHLSQHSPVAATDDQHLGEERAEKPAVSGVGSRKELSRHGLRGMARNPAARRARPAPALGDVLQGSTRADRDALSSAERRCTRNDGPRRALAAAALTGPEGKGGGGGPVCGPRGRLMGPGLGRPRGGGRGRLTLRGSGWLQRGRLAIISW